MKSVNYSIKLLKSNRTYHRKALKQDKSLAEIHNTGSRVGAIGGRNLYADGVKLHTAIIADLTQAIQTLQKVKK